MFHCLPKYPFKGSIVCFKGMDVSDSSLKYLSRSQLGKVSKASSLFGHLHNLIRILDFRLKKLQL